MERLFQRTESSEVSWDGGSSELVVEVVMEDAFHRLGVSVRFHYPELEITHVRPWAERMPYPICPSVLARVQRCVGLRVGPGISFLLQRQIGGQEGCRHWTRLTTDACHAAISGLLARKCAEDGRRGSIPSAEKIAFLEGHGLSIRNSCLAYAVRTAE